MQTDINQSDVKLDVQNLPSPDNDPNFSKLIQKVGSIKLDKNNIIPTLHSIMEAVEVVDKTLNGTNKKDLAIKAIKWLADKQTDLSEPDKLFLNTLIDQVVPPAIDVIIDVSNGISNLVKTKCPCF
jgi:hypothetical protein